MGSSIIATQLVLLLLCGCLNSLSGSNETINQNGKSQTILKRRAAFSELSGKPTMADFEEFIKVYNKKYSDEGEKDRRFRIFQTNAAIAQNLTATDQGTAIYGITKFSDLTQEEFKIYHNLDFRSASVQLQQAKIPNIHAPESVDWRKKGAVTYVKDQGQCGSCWAFSTTGNIEGQWFLKKGKLIPLSESELVDCDTIDHGCSGGLMANAYQAIINLGGLESERSYPYQPRKGNCKFNKKDVVATILGGYRLAEDEGYLAKWCAANGPIANGINANVMQHYKGGISHPPIEQCNPVLIDHGVLIVGYGKEGNTPYWIIKNSWGSDWGEKGYYRIFRGDGVCGVNQVCSSAKVP